MPISHPHPRIDPLVPLVFTSFARQPLLRVGLSSSQKHLGDSGLTPMTMTDTVLSTSTSQFRRP
eukprot:scaffold106646_cov31-Tisochrysis_lutea.AAC.8